LSQKTQEAGGAQLTEIDTRWAKMKNDVGESGERVCLGDLEECFVELKIARAQVRVSRLLAKL
jgi:hypothetical protein